MLKRCSQAYPDLEDFFVSVEIPNEIEERGESVPQALRASGPEAEPEPEAENEAEVVDED